MRAVGQAQDPTVRVLDEIGSCLRFSLRSCCYVVTMSSSKLIARLLEQSVKESVEVDFREDHVLMLNSASLCCAAQHKRQDLEVCLHGQLFREPYWHGTYNLAKNFTMKRNE